VAFLCLLRACLPNLTTLGSIDQQRFAKTKMGYISLPSGLNAIIGMKSYYCVVLKMVILHYAIKTIQSSFLCIFKKKEQKPVSFQKNKKKGLKNKKSVNCFFKPVFFQPGFFQSYFFLFYDFLLIARSGTSHVTINLIGCTPHT